MFFDENLSKQFDQQGFVKTNLLTTEQVEALNKLYLATKDESGLLDRQFYTSIWSQNEAYKKKVGDGIKEIMLPSLSKILKDSKAVFANFMVKLRGEHSALQPHQDWSFVDENQYESMTVWVPLKEVNAKNGALEVFPKSNYLKNTIRARFANAPFTEVMDYLRSSKMESVPMKAGEALFINSRTIHASPSNLSNEDRIAISIVMIPSGASCYHYVLDKENSNLIHKFEAAPSFFEKYSCFDYPEIPAESEQIINHYFEPILNQNQLEF